MNLSQNINSLHGNKNFHESEPLFVIDKYNKFFDKPYEVSLYFTFSLLFNFTLVGGCFFLNMGLITSTPIRKESQCCFWILVIYGVLTAFSPPLVYELILGDDFISIIHISAEIPKNLSLFFRILSIYIVVVFALNCYLIVFRGSTKHKYSKFYIYISITLLLIFCLLLTLLMWFLRDSLFDKANPYCHFYLMASIQSVYCPETTYWMLFLLFIYIIPIFIPFILYPKIIYEVATKYEFFECGYVKYLVDNNRGKHLFRSDYRFLKISCMITMVFLLTNIPFVIIEILYILKFKVNIMVAISFEIIARYASMFYPFICVEIKCRSGDYESSCYRFMHPEKYKKRPSVKMTSLLVDCEATIKEQEELLKVMRVNVKTVSSAEIKTKLTNEDQVHSDKL